MLERATRAALELALRMRPEELSQSLDIARSYLAEAYRDATFSPDLIDDEEREFVASEVENQLRGLQHELGFKGGILRDEEG